MIQGQNASNKECFLPLSHEPYHISICLLQQCSGEGKADVIYTSSELDGCLLLSLSCLHTGVMCSCQDVSCVQNFSATPRRGKKEVKPEGHLPLRNFPFY